MSIIETIITALGIIVILDLILLLSEIYKEWKERKRSP